MIRFVHTADWQLGMAAAQLGAAGDEVRAQRLKTGGALVARANEVRAELLLVAGDLFEDHAVEGRLVQSTADILSRFNGTVYILPGNHDPLAPGGVWEHPAWSAAENVIVLERPEPVPLPGGTLLPCPLTGGHGSQDPTAWIGPESDSRDPSAIRIGLAHGNVVGLPGADSDFPIARDAAHRGALDYLALGHWHSCATFADPAGAERMAYAGTPEPTRFGERASGKALLVEITEAGATPRLTVWDTGHFAWQRVTAELGLADDLQRLSARITKITGPERTLLEVRLKGLLRADQQTELQQFMEQITARFFFSRFQRDDLRPAPEDESWIHDLPPGILQETARHLQARARTSAGDDPEAAAAGLALQELYTLAGEADS